MGDAGRVISGTARGIRLLAPGSGTRPLGDRLKQTLFGILDPILPGARVLDLFAGSGAAAIEALSRGATSAVLIEHDARTAAVAHANLVRTGLAGATVRVVRADALRYLEGAAAADGPFDVVILDAPYGEPDLLLRSLERLGGAPNAAPLLAADAWVVAKSFWRDRPPDRIGLLASARERRSGESTLTFYRPVSDPGADDRREVEAG